MKRARAIGNVAALVFAAATCAELVYALIALPARIASHFGAGGVSYGSKLTLLLLLVPILGIFGLFAWVERRPLSAMNLPIATITPNNEQRVHDAVLAMLAWMKACTIALFATIALASVQSAGGTLSPLFLMATFWVIPLFGVLAYFMIAIAAIAP